MNKENGFLELLFGWLASAGYRLWLLGGAAYIWSIIIALKEWGLGGAFVTFCLPIVGQLFWTYKIWKVHSFESNFVLISVLSVVCFILSLITIRLSAKYAKTS